MWPIETCMSLWPSMPLPQSGRNNHTASGTSLVALPLLLRS
jgi:hypothetical protein